MTRQVTHAPKVKNVCECGARFHSPRDLRRHLAKANGEETFGAVPRGKDRLQGKGR